MGRYKVIFSRGRGSGGRHHRADDARAAHRAAQESDETEGLDREGAEDDVVDEAVGPYDVSEAPDGAARLDLGSLQIPTIDGVEVRVQANPQGQIQQVVLVHGGSALQLAAFAAPRSEGIWDEVRADIRGSLSSQGITAEESEGEYGVELRARVPRPEGMASVRFVGIEGPRWLVQALYQGAAATDPAAAGPLARCLEGLVVDRGQAAMPVREPLPLRLPKEVAEQAQQSQMAADGRPQPAGGPDHGHDHRHVNGAGPAAGAAHDPGGPAAGGSGGSGGSGGATGAGGSGGQRRRPSPRPRRKP